MSGVGKVWLVLPWGPENQGGVTGVVLEMLRFWSAQDTGTSASLIVNDWTAREPVVQATHVRHRLSVVAGDSLRATFRSMVLAPVTLWRTLTALRRERVVAVNFHYVTTAPFGIALLKRLGLYRGRLVISFHGTDVRPAANPVDALLRRLTHRWADALVACSPALAERMVETFGCARDKVIVIANGVDADLFRPGLPRPPDLDLPPGRYIVSVGSYIPRKAHADLVRAFAAVAGEHPDLSLCIAGPPGPLYEATAALSRELGIAARVRLMQGLTRGQVAGLLSGCEACVLPSRAESMPLAVLEAAAAGVPVVATAIAGHVPLVEEGSTGFLFRPADPADCSRALRSLLGDRAAAQAMAARLHAHVISELTWARCVARYQAAFALNRLQGGETRRA